MYRTVLIEDRASPCGARARRSEEDWSSDSRCCSNVTTRSLSARVIVPESGFECSGYQFEKRALPASIRAQQPKPLSRPEQEIEILHDRPPAERFAELRGLDQLF